MRSTLCKLCIFFVFIICSEKNIFIEESIELLASSLLASLGGHLLSLPLPFGTRSRSVFLEHANKTHTLFPFGPCRHLAFHVKEMTAQSNLFVLRDPEYVCSEKNTRKNHYRERRLRNMQLLKFLQGLLDDTEHRYEQLLKWEDRDDGIFKIIAPNDLALLWGRYKNSQSMNYDKMSRALRYYYKDNILSKCGRLCYRIHWENPLFLAAHSTSFLVKKESALENRTDFIKLEDLQ